MDKLKNDTNSDVNNFDEVSDSEYSYEEVAGEDDYDDEVNEDDDYEMGDDYDYETNGEKDNQDPNVTKRRRGRPRKNQIMQQIIKKKRGRKPKDNSSTTKTSVSVLEDEIVLHLPITMDDVLKYGKVVGDNLSETSTTKSTSNDTNNKTKLSASPQNIFTLTDISYGSSSSSNNSPNDSENYDESYKNLLEKIKSQEKLIKELHDEITNYKNITNNGLIERKAIKLNTDFIDMRTGKQVFLDKTDIACWWCTYIFDTMPCVLPEKFTDNTYYVFGCFCSYNCAMAYNLDMDDYKVWDRIALIKTLYNSLYEKDIDIIPPAPPRECLQKFGGYMTMEDFRKCSLKNDKEYRLIMPPMKSIVPSIEENCKNNNFINKIKGTSNSLDNLVLRRTKPLPNSKNMLFETMGLTQKRKPNKIIKYSTVVRNYCINHPSYCRY